MEIKRHIILASSSPRRIQMMREHGYEPEIFPADINEIIPEYRYIHQVPMYLALKKALNVYQNRENDGSIIISADTLVCKLKTHQDPESDEEYVVSKKCGANQNHKNQEECGSCAKYELKAEYDIMGKPSDPTDGFRMLALLRNSEHLVITGVCIWDMLSEIKKVFYDKTIVRFGDYSDEELREYLMTSEPYDKAGGYAIQGNFGKHVTSIDGSYENVIGFPWELIQNNLYLFKEV